MMNPGNIVLFGTCKQNLYEVSTGIQWIVLDIVEDKALLVSRFALAAKHYNDLPGETTWEKCSLRAWLNKEFYESAFSEEEKKAILLTPLENKDPERVYMYEPYNEDNMIFPVQIPASMVSVPTEDRVFLLTSEDVRTYKDRMTEKEPVRYLYLLPTDYAVEQGVFKKPIYLMERSGSVTEDYVDYCYLWWLRERSEDGNRVACVMGDKIGKEFVYDSEYVLHGVRPAIWVDKDALNNMKIVNVESVSLMNKMGIDPSDLSNSLKLLDKKTFSVCGKTYDVRSITAHEIALFAACFPCAEPETIQELKAIYFFSPQFGEFRRFDHFPQFDAEKMFLMYEILNLLLGSDRI